MRILLTSITGTQNRGVEALVLASIDGFRTVASDCEIGFLTSQTAHDRTRVDDKIGIYPDGSPNYGHGGLKGFRCWVSQFVPRAERRVAEMGRAITDADIVVASGGDVYSSDYGAFSLKKNCSFLKLAQQKDKKTYFLSQSVGIFKNDQDIATWKEVAKNCDHITVRETKSYDYLLNKLNVDKDKVTLTADPAFILEPATSAWVEGCYHSLGLTNERPVVVLVPSEGITYFKNLDRRQHDEAWKKIIRLVRDKLGVEVLLLPHVHDPFMPNDDRIIATRLFSALVEEGGVHLAPGNLSSREYKGLISRAEIVISERMHPAIGGLSSCVPTLPVRYSIKADGIIGDLFDAEKFGKLFIDIPDFMAVEPAMEQIEKAWGMRTEIRASLEAKMPEMRERALNAFRIILGS